MSPPDVRALAMVLPADERAALALDLIRSLDGPADEGAATAWDAEIARRCREIDDGTAELVDWEDVDARITSGLNARGTSPSR